MINKNIIVNDLINKSASLYLLSFSRSQEYEADQLAVRYMSRAGFDPKEMGEFLRLMERFSRLRRKIAKDVSQTSELLKLILIHLKGLKKLLKSQKKKFHLIQ